MKKMYFKSVFTLFCLIIAGSAWAGAGYRIQIQIDNYEGEELYLAHYLGDKVYIDDTTSVQTDGLFLFEGEEKLPAGMYVLVAPPDNKFVELLITEEEQEFSLQLDATRLNEDLVFKNSLENTLFYEYIQFMQTQRETYENIQKQAEETAAQQLKVIEADIRQYRKTVIQKYPSALTSTIIKSQLGVEPPAFQGEEQEVQRKSFYYRKQHYFDAFRKDPRFFKSRLLFDMTGRYIDKLTVQHPDSISRSADEILTLVEPDSLAFRFYFIHLFNKYANSKFVGMDAVYVHLVNEYVRKGKTNFITGEEQEKMLDNATQWEPILLGKIAPEIKLFTLDVEGTLERKDAEKEMDRFQLDGETSLHSVESDFTVLVFWSPTCGVCKKAMPKIVDFHEKYKERGVEVFAVCTEYYKGLPACAEALKNYKALKWINAVDPFFHSKFKKKFAVGSTPMIYVLDKEKEILIKKIGAEQLPEIMDDFIEKKAKGSGRR